MMVTELRKHPAAKAIPFLKDTKSKSKIYLETDKLIQKLLYGKDNKKTRENFVYTFPVYS